MKKLVLVAIFGLVMFGLLVTVNIPIVSGSSYIGEWYVPPSFRMLFIEFLSKAEYRCYQAIIPGVWVLYPGLQVLYVNESESTKKFSLIFDAGQNWADYKINITLKECLNYEWIGKNHTFNINFVNYSVWFNTHDLHLLGNLIFNYGKNGSVFWMTVQKNHIRRLHVILDPRYTISNAYTSYATDYANGRKLVRMSNGTLMTAFLYGYGLSIPPRYVIRSARSINAGVTWQVVNVTATMSTSGYFSGVALWCNSTNYVHCVYANYTRIGYRVYNPTSKTWSSTETKIGDSAFAFDARYPSISGGYNNTFYVAWSQVTHATAGRDNIRFQSCTAGTWSGIVNLTDINSAGYICDMPNVVVDSVGDVYVFYRMKTPTGFALYSIKRTGGVWGDTVLVSSILSTHALGMDAPCGAMYKNDSVCVVIGRNRYPLASEHSVLFSTSNDSGATWVNNFITGVAGHTLKYPSVCIDNLSYAHVVWIDNVTGTKGETIQYSNSTNFGRSWSSNYIFDSGSTNRRSPGMLWCLSPKNATRHFDVPSVGFCLVWTNATTVRYYSVSTLAWNTQYVNRVPTVTILYPTTGETTDVGWACRLNASVSDLDFDTLSLTWRDNHSGVWSVFAYNNSVPNGIYRQINEDFNNLSENDYWNVTVSDGRLSAVGDSRFATASKDLTWVVNLENCTRTINAVYSKYTGWTLYENDTGNTTPIFQNENIINATGTHEYLLNGTGYWDWANYTGDTTPIHPLENIVNASGTHDYLLNGTGYWIWANYTGYNALNFIEHLVNATGGHQQYWSGTNWTIWNNYTGTTTPLHQNQNIINATGTHEYLLNGTGYWDWANYTGNETICDSTALTLFENIVNATGFHNSSYNATTGWNVWANYTGNTTSITLYDDISEANGEHEYILNGTGYHVWANYTGWSSALNIIENFINATGTHDQIYSMITGWTVYANITGNTTPIFQNENIINATGTHEYLLNGTGYWDWANYTGDTTPIHPLENIVNASGTHDYLLNGTGYWIWANYTGLNGLNLFENIINAVGTHESFWDGTDWNIWANYTGTGGGTTSFIVHNPNPGNGTLSYNYLRKNGAGLETAVDISSISWANPINLTWYSNSSGSWVQYAFDSCNANGTYQHLNVNMTNSSTTYWWRVVAENITDVVLSNQTWVFETGKTSIMPISIAGASVGILVPLSSVCLIGGLLGVRRRRKQT